MKIGNPIQMIRAGICALTLLSALVTPLSAQQVPGNESIDVVPAMVKFSGVLVDDSGKPPAGIVGVTFSLYRDQQGGAPLWMDTQNVQPDKAGHYSVMLGSASSKGLPADLFASGEPRWVGVQLQGQPEQPRVMLVSVPYALKSKDAETVGGLPASAFVLAAPSNVVGKGATSSAGLVSTPNVPVPGSITGSGTAGFLPKFTGAATIGNSAVFQSGSSPTAKIGIDTSTPTASLDVNGSAHVRGNLSATGLVTGSAYYIGSSLFGFGSTSTGNTFLGFSGNLTTTGTSNTAIGRVALFNNVDGFLNTATGAAALYSNTSGYNNIATGNYALDSNTTGYYNSATGAYALENNTTGFQNTADGRAALAFNTTGTNNTGLGNHAGGPTDNSNFTGSNDTFIGANTAPSTGTLTNATAIGANAEVDQSNSLVLGSINGVRGATADTAVGIGTTTPLNTPLGGNPPTKLNIVGNNTFVPLVVQSPSTFGTWMVLNNTSSGGKTWAILSAASGNGEGAGNLGITNFGAGGTIILEANVQVNGNLIKNGGQFKIDHPVDPANKYLSHSFVESPDMMNIYNGVVRLDARGAAWITLPDYFEALNRDFRYQLTSIEKPQPNLYVAREVSRNRFKISGGKPGGRVSWQVTGVRHDAWANAHRIPIEEDKPQQLRGKYFHPELFGAPPENRIGAIPVGTPPAISQDTRAEAPRPAVPQEQHSQD